MAGAWPRRSPAARSISKPSRAARRGGDRGDLGLRGFGRWSAEIYLLFALGRADIFPADDLGLQVGMQRLKRLEARPNRKALDLLVEHWRPLRGCGAIFLWHYYGAATLDEAKPAPAA